MTRRPISQRAECPRRPWWAVMTLIVLVLQAGCASWLPHIAERDDVSIPQKEATDETQVRLELSAHFEAVRVTQAQVDAALTDLMLQRSLRVASTPRASPPRVVRVSLMEATRGSRLSHAYAEYCEQLGTPGDCLQLYRDGPGLDDKDKRDIALALAVSTAIDSRDEAVRAMFSTSQLWTTVSLTLATYMALLVAPEPVSKGVAAALAVLMWAYLGAEFFTLIRAYFTLWEEAAEASTFTELREAGERFGKVIGPNSVHILLMLGTAAVGEAASLMSRVQQLPGYTQAALRAGKQSLRLREAALGADRLHIAVTEGTVGVVLPTNALSMAARDSLGRSGPAPSGRQVHHIATVENNKSTARGGPWTPRFKKLFDKAGLSMEDAANMVELEGHQGPHSEAYHTEVYERLYRATAACQNPLQCRNALVAQLQQLARELADPQSAISQLLKGEASH